MNNNWKALGISVVVVAIGALLVLTTSAFAYVTGNGYGSFTTYQGNENLWVGDTPSCDNNVQINSHWVSQAVGRGGTLQQWGDRVATEGMKTPYNGQWYLSKGTHTFTIVFWIPYRANIDWSNLHGNERTQAKIQVYGQVWDNNNNVYVGDRHYTLVVNNEHIGSGVGSNQNVNLNKEVTIQFQQYIPSAGEYKLDCGVLAETHVLSGTYSSQHCGADLDLSPDGGPNESCYCNIASVAVS